MTSRQRELQWTADSPIRREDALEAMLPAGGALTALVIMLVILIA